MGFEAIPINSERWSSQAPDGRLFHRRHLATGNVRSSTVDSRVRRITDIDMTKLQTSNINPKIVTLNVSLFHCNVSRQNNGAQNSGFQGKMQMLSFIFVTPISTSLRETPKFNVFVIKIRDGSGCKREEILQKNEKRGMRKITFCRKEAPARIPMKFCSLTDILNKIT